MGPGKLLTPKSYVDVPAELWKIDFVYTNFFTQLPNHQYTIFDRKPPNFSQIKWFFFFLFLFFVFLFCFVFVFLQ